MTIMEHVRSMRFHARLTLQFWEDIVDNVVYLIKKRTPISSDGGIPEEAWTSKNINYSFFKTFGCE